MGRKRQEIQLSGAGLLAGLAVLLVGILMVLCDARLYELQLEREELEEEWSELQTEIGDLKHELTQAERDVINRAEALGMERASAEDMVIIHVRNGMTAGNYEYYGCDKAYSEEETRERSHAP